MNPGSPRKVCAVLVDRSNYGRLKPVMSAITTKPELDLQCLAAGTTVQERFGLPVASVKQDGFRVDGEIRVELPDSTPTTMAMSVGLILVEFASALIRLEPYVQKRLWYHKQSVVTPVGED